MNSPCSWRTLQSVSVQNSLQCCLHVLSPLEINEVWISLWYLNHCFSIVKFQFRPLPYRSWLCNLYHPVCRILLSFFVFSLDSMHQTLHSGIQCLSTMLLHHSIILWIVRRTWKQLHRLITPVMEWMESQCSSNLKFESNFHIHRNLPAHTVPSLVPMGLIKNPKTPCPVGELAVAWWFHSEC